MRLHAGELADVYLADGRAAVLVGDTVMALSELATSVLVALVAAPSGLSLAELTARLVEEYGDPGDAEAMTRTTVAELVAGGVVREES